MSYLNYIAFAKKERIMQVLRNDISNVLSDELWICMKVSKAIFKKEKSFKGKKRLSKETKFKKVK